MKREPTNNKTHKPGFFTEPVRAWFGMRFRSRLCDPWDDLCILPHALKERMKAAERKISREEA